MTKYIVVVALAVFVIVAGVAAPVTAGYPDASATCEAVQSPTALVVLSDGTTFTSQTHSVYPGTEFRLFLCQGDGDREPISAWSLSTPDGFTATENADGNYYRVTVNGTPSGASLATSDRVAPPDNLGRLSGPTIAVATGNVVSTRPPLDRKTSEVTVYFETASEAQSYRSAVEEYHTNVKSIYGAAERINETNGSVRAVSNQTIDRLGSYSAEQTGYQEVKRALAPAAKSGNPGAASALETYHDVQQRTADKAQAALKARQQVLQSQARGHAWRVLINLFGTLAGGLLLGFGVGWYVTKQRVDEVTYHRRRTSTVDFDPSLMQTPLIAAAVLAVLAVGLVIATGLLQPLVEVIVTVIS